MDGMSVIDNAVPGSNFRNIRITCTTGGSDNHGNLLYYVITGMAMPNTFTNDAAGAAALATAEKSRAFIFPRASGDPLNPDPSNRRQDNVFDYVYDPRNPLGLWTATFPIYTQPRSTPQRASKRLPLWRPRTEPTSTGRRSSSARATS